MTLGGLHQGVTPLDMAHAYETFIEHGRRIGGTLGAGDDGPVGIDEVAGAERQGRSSRTTERATPVLEHNIADQTVGIMTTVISQGTGRRAALGPGKFAAGKTGTTENSGDAWFVGFNERWTVAVWVGYADKLKPMLTEFAGAPVEGGTFPALIWHDFMVAGQRDRRRPQRQGPRAQGAAAQAARGHADHDHPGARHPDQAGAGARGRRQRAARPADPDGTAEDGHRHRRAAPGPRPARAPARRPTPPAQTTTPAARRAAPPAARAPAAAPARPRAPAADRGQAALRCARARRPRPRHVAVARARRSASRGRRPW